MKIHKLSKKSLIAIGRQMGNRVSSMARLNLLRENITLIKEDSNFFYYKDKEDIK